MAATSFADFLGEKLNDLRNRVVAEYCINVTKLEREASNLRSENWQLHEQLKLQCLSRQAEGDSHDPPPLLEAPQSEEQINPPEAAEGERLLPQPPACEPTALSLAMPSDTGTYPPESSAESRGSFSALSLPPLEPLSEGEEDEEQKARSSVASQSSNSRQQELPDIKDEPPVELTVDLPPTLTWTPQSSAQEDVPVKLPEGIKRLQEAHEETSGNTSKLSLGVPGLIEQNGSTSLAHSSPASPVADKAEVDFAGSGSCPAVATSTTSDKLNHSLSASSLKPPDSASFSSLKGKRAITAPALPVPGGNNVQSLKDRATARQSVVSVMKGAFNGIHQSRHGQSQIGNLMNQNRTSTLAVPQRQSSVLPVSHGKVSPFPGTSSPMASPRTSSQDVLESKQAAAASAAMTDVLDEFEGKNSIAGSPRNSLRNSYNYGQSVEEANGYSPTINTPDQCAGMASKVHSDIPFEQTETAVTDLNGIASEEPEIVFEVWPIWTYTKDFGLTRKGAGETTNLEDAIGDMNDDSDDDEENEEQPVEGWLLMRILMQIIMHPGSPQRIFWDCLGVLCISYEFVMLPLQFLSLPQGPFILGAAWAMRLYWTCDFPMSFLTGYNRSDGKIEKRPCKIAKNYVSTWMPFDICVLTLDWIEVAAGGLDGLGAARAGKAFKALRLLRMLRLIRLVRLRRMPEFMRVIAYKFQGERFVIVFGIIRIMIFLIGINHFIACCWYGIGDSTGDIPPESHRANDNGSEVMSQDKSSQGWVYEYNFHRQELGYKYVTSFHWSITQFTGSADIYPQNVGERTFAVMSLLFGFLLSASVVSSITSSMTRLQIVTARQSTQVSMLKQYLFDNGISTKVALRVQRNAMYTLSQATKNTPESSIELLSLVSEPLRMDLHYEIHMPTLCQHPFFKCYNEVNSPAMKKVCHTCVSQLQLSRGDVLFSSGEIPPSPCTYFCINGKLQYLQEYGFRNGGKSMYAGNWSCEAVLWTAWVHIGMLRAKTECSLQLLGAGAFQSIATQFQTREFYPKKYAEAFVQRLNTMDKELLSDLASPDLDVDSICEMVFPRVRASTGEQLGDTNTRLENLGNPVVRIGRKLSKASRSSKGSLSSAGKDSTNSWGSKKAGKHDQERACGMGSSDSSKFSFQSRPSQASKASSIGKISPSPSGASKKDLPVNVIFPPI